MGTRRNAPALSVVAVCLLGSLTGCAKAPQQDVVDASEALREAKAANASTYAPQRLEKAQASLDEALTLIAREQRKLAPFRSYEMARKSLAEAKATAVQARAEAHEAARKADIEKAKQEQQKASGAKTTKKKSAKTSR